MREYIGSRYVPKFMGVYDATQVYEALCVVDNGQGTSYITRKPTPAGTPLTDSDYWFIYGASSGAIINLQDQIDDMNDGTVPGSLQNQINTIDSKITRNILILGNSYVDRGCAAKLRAMFNNSVAFTGSGTGFLTYNGHTTDVFEALLTQAAASSGVDNDSITDIIFVSAMGDTRARSERGLTAFENELTAAITACVNTINANFINCNRISITFAETRNVPSFSDYPNPYSALFDVHKTFRKICGSLGVDYLGWSGFNSLFVSADLDSDHYHPTTTGASHIGQFIKDSYFGHAEYMTKQSQSSCNFGGQSGKTMTCVARLLPDSCSLNVRYVTLSSGSINISPSNPVVDLSAIPIPIPAPNPTIDFRVTLYEISSNNDVMKIPVNISNDNDGVAVIKTTYTLSETIASNMNAMLEGLESFSYII